MKKMRANIKAVFASLSRLQLSNVKKLKQKGKNYVDKVATICIIITKYHYMANPSKEGDAKLEGLRNYSMAASCIS